MWQQLGQARTFLSFSPVIIIIFFSRVHVCVYLLAQALNFRPKALVIYLGQLIHPFNKNWPCVSR